MEYSTHVFIQQTPITEQNFELKYVRILSLKFFHFPVVVRVQEISDQISSHGCVCPSVFAPFTNLVVQQAVVSARHIAFLLQVIVVVCGR